MEFLTFMCKAKNDATIGLARGHDSHELYEIVLGGWDNTISWIARSRMGKFINSYTLMMIQLFNRTRKIFTWNFQQLLLLSSVDLCVDSF